VSFSAPGSAHSRRWLAFETEIKEELGDRVALAMLTGGQLGNEDSMLSSLRRGRAQMGIISTGALSVLTPELSVLSAPFLFDSNEQADFVMDEILFQPYAALLADKGLTLIKWEDGGWHNVYARRPLITPQDFKAYRLRSSATEATRMFLSALGADVVVLDFGDIVSALETGLVDGGVTTSTMYRVTGLYEEAPHYTLTRHAFSPGALLANKGWFEDLPGDVRDVILHAHGTADGGRHSVREEIEYSETLVRDAGTHMYELSPEERQRWAALTVPVTKRLIALIGRDAELLFAMAQNGKQRFTDQRAE